MKGGGEGGGGKMSGGGGSKAVRSVWLSKRVDRNKQCNEIVRKIDAMMRKILPVVSLPPPISESTWNFSYDLKIKSDLCIASKFMSSG